MKLRPATRAARTDEGRIGRGWARLFALLAATAFIGCGEPTVQRVESDSGSVVLARVNGQEVTQSDLNSFREQLSQTPSSGDEVGSDSDLLESLIQQEALYQEARNQGVRVEPSLVEKMGEALGPQLSESALRQIERFLVTQKYLQQRLAADSGISLIDLQRYYELNADEFVAQDRRRVLEILVKDRPGAEQLKSQLEPGDFRTFRELARRHSVGITAESGGELGVFQAGDLPQRFEDFIFRLRVGEISPIFQSEHGFHIFVIEEQTPQHFQKFYEVKEEIFRRMVSDRERDQLHEIVNEILMRASIEVAEAGRREMENN